MMTHTQPMRNFDCYTVRIRTSTLEETQRTIAQYADCTIKRPTETYLSYFETMIENKQLDTFGAPKIEELECWRCGSENAAFVKPAHPDGGGDICHTCWDRMFGERE